MDLGQVGPQGRGAPEAFHGLARLALVLEGVAQVDQGPDVTGP